MSKLIHFLGAVSVAALLTAAPVYAADNPPPANSLPDAAEKALREGAETIMRALQLLVGKIPQYEMPEVLDNGDIIIRRKPPEPAPEKKRMPRGGDQTKT